MLLQVETTLLAMNRLRHKWNINKPNQQQQNEICIGNLHTEYSRHNAEIYHEAHSNEGRIQV